MTRICSNAYRHRYSYPLGQILRHSNRIGQPHGCCIRTLYNSQHKLKLNRNLHSATCNFLRHLLESLLWNHNTHISPSCTHLLPKTIGPFQNYYKQILIGLSVGFPSKKFGWMFSEPLLWTNIIQKNLWLCTNLTTESTTPIYYMT